MNHGPIAAVLLLTACAGARDPVPSTAPPRACDALTSLTVGTSVIRSASSVTGPLSLQGLTVGTPFCRVQGVARPSSESEITFEVWMPSTPAAWTGRLKVNGTGGFSGATPYARLAQDIAEGFASVGSDMGHVGGESASWTLNHPEKVKDWGLRAHYHVTTAAKAVILAFYGRAADRSYFEGCSNGGRQGMMLAQRYPELFDGIAVGAPSMFYPDALMAMLWSAKQQVPVLGQPAVLSVAKRAMMNRRVLEACDAQDGLADGEITNPRACTFDLESLRCRGEASDACLTDREFAVARQITRGLHTAAGAPRWSGPVPGAENNWVVNFADIGGYGQFIEHVVFSEDSPSFDWRRQLDYDNDYERVKQVMTPVIAAPSPDLSAFRARGGKLIHYHGWNDAINTPQPSTNYFNAVAQFETLKRLSPAEFEQRINALAPQDIPATTVDRSEDLQRFYRLFMMPGVAHCGILTEGTGPNAIGGGFQPPPMRDAEHDVVLALIRWVEEGKAPERLVASRSREGRVVRERPLCPYPKQAAYRGTGDIEAASSFVCSMPALDQLVTTAVDVVQVQNALRLRELTTSDR